jgi:hypothetical protein
MRSPVDFFEVGAWPQVDIKASLESEEPGMTTACLAILVRLYVRGGNTP